MVKDDSYYFHQTPEELCEKLIKEISSSPSSSSSSSYSEIVLTRSN